MVGLGKILYVEDDPDIRLIAELSLQTVGGYELCLCESGKVALSLARDFRPDLLLLDMMMPGMDGPATLAALRQIPELQQVPAVFLTARSLDQTDPELRAQGMIGVIRKPFDPMTLPQEVKSVWEHWHEQSR